LLPEQAASSVPKLISRAIRIIARDPPRNGAAQELDKKVAAASAIPVTNADRQENNRSSLWNPVVTEIVVSPVQHRPQR
jgi:hypothetical protein